MSDGLKPGWRRVKFGEVVQLNKDTSKNPEADGLDRYVGLEHLEPGDLRIRSWGNIADGTTFTNRFRSGQVLFGKRRAYQRKVAVADFDGICSGDIYVFESKDPNILLPELLPFICQTDAFFDHAVGTSAGSLSPRTNWKSLANYEFALPPLEKQPQIVRALVAFDETVESETNALIKLQVVRQSTIDCLLASHDKKEMVRLDSVSSMQNGRPFPSNAYQATGIRLLRPGNLGVSGYFSWPEEKTVCLDQKWKSKAIDFVVDPGDVVINLTAQSLEDGFMGRVCLAREEDNSCLLNQRIGRFLCDKENLIPDYLFRALQTSSFRQHAETHCEGTKVQHLFWSHLSKYEICLPSIEEQQEIVNTCRQIDEAITALERRVNSAKMYRNRAINEIAQGGST